jgi:2,4-dienoyl-CoA reductase-like NADH-dependent reductase (Old Yellow Enzyme family)
MRPPHCTPVQYYAQRASAGLVIGECTEISPDAYGWADTPGLWSAEQVRGWRGVTDAVHKKGGLMYAQLWHTGAMSHPDFFDMHQLRKLCGLRTATVCSCLAQLADNGVVSHDSRGYQLKRPLQPPAVSLSAAIDSQGKRKRETLPLTRN